MMTTKVNKTPNVEKLRKAGWKIRVYHGRKYTAGYNTVTSYEDCYFHSRREFANLNQYIMQDYKLSSHDGFTVVEVTKDGITGRGKFNVPSGRQFNRKIGLKAALGRAMQNYNVVHNVGWSECNFILTPIN